MVPRTQMKAVEADAAIDEAISLMIGAASASAVYEDSTDNIAGSSI